MPRGLCLSPLTHLHGTTVTLCQHSSYASTAPGPKEQRGQKFSYPPRLGGTGRGSSGGEGQVPFSGGLWKVTLWPGSLSSPPPPPWRPGAKAFVPGSEELLVAAGTPACFLPPSASSKGALSRKGPLRWFGESKLVGKRSSQNHLLLLQRPFHQNKVFARPSELLQRFGEGQSHTAHVTANFKSFSQKCKVE